ncbi:hypothetical protein BGZ50_009489 [Haplosporangium sp. Z 11]|nr:hypothetical protein BGZ50_009489 [Haplosporangium sp. Z 11]
MLFETAGNTLSAPGSNPQSNRSSLVISTVGGSVSDNRPLTPSTTNQHILDNNSNKMRSVGPGALTRHASAPYSSSTTFVATATTSSSSTTAVNESGASSITDSLTDLVKPFLGRSLTQPGGPSNPSSRLAAAASLRTPIAAGLPANVVGTGAMGSTAVSKASLRSKNMAASAIGTARNHALQAGVPGAVVTIASREAQTRANSSISSASKSVDQALSEADRLKADVRRMLNR